MSTPADSPSPDEGVSRLVVEDGQRLLRTSREHAISEDWLLEHAPDLFAAGRTATPAPRRDAIAAAIDRRFDAVETSPLTHRRSLGPEAAASRRVPDLSRAPRSAAPRSQDGAAADHPPNNEQITAALRREAETPADPELTPRCASARPARTSPR